MTDKKNLLQEEWIKCASDPVYFINSYAYAFNAVKSKVDRIECFEYQETLLEAYLKHKWNIILKSRQTGISVITAAYVAWKMIFGIDENILVIANSLDGAKRFLDHVKKIISLLPEELHTIDNEITSSQTVLEIGSKDGNFKNRIKASAAGPQAGRGESPTLLILDEWAFVQWDSDIWMSVAVSLSMTGGDCIVISTPNGTGNKYHQFWVEAESGRSAFNPIKIHWTENPVAAKGLHWKYDYKGRRYPTSPWYEEQKQKLNFDPVKIAQELDLSFLGSKLLALEIEDIDKARDNLEERGVQPICYFNPMPEQDYFTKMDNGFHIFKMPVKGKSYILAADVAYKGVDKSTIQILDVETAEQVAEYQGKVDPDRFAYFINKVALFYNEAYVVVEANNHGYVTCFELRNKLKYKKLFHSKSLKDLYVQQYDFDVNEGDSIPGFQTTVATRPSVVNSIRIALRDRVIINSRRLISEMETFIIDKNGKEVAESGYHDDLIMAYGIALYIRETEYKNATYSKRMTEAMLDAISYNSNGIYQKNETPEQKAIRLEQEANGASFEGKIIGGIFTNKSLSKQDDDNDIGWLFA